MRCFLFILLCSAVFEASAQTPFHRDLPLTESGAPIRVNDMVFDAAGYLWLGTAQGLFRHNGRTATPAPPNSARRPVTALAAQGNALFIGFEDGNVMVLRGLKARRIYGTALSSSITCLLPTPFGLLVGTAGEGIALVRSEGTYQVTTANGLGDDYVYSMAFSAPGKRLVAGTDRGTTLFLWDRLADTLSVRHQSPDAGALPPGSPALTDITRVVRLTGTGTAWLGTEENGVVPLPWANSGGPGTSSGFYQSVSEGAKWGPVTDILPVSGSAAWYVTEGGALVFVDGAARGQALRFTPYFLPGKRIHRALRSPSDDLWLATSEGLTIVTAGYLENIDPGPAYTLRALSAIAAGREGTLWYAQDAALYSYDKATGSSRLRFTAPETITTLYIDSRERLWIGTLGGGLLCREGEAVRPVSNIQNLRGGHILHIAGRDDTLWVSSLNGVEVLKLDETNIGAPRVAGRHSRASGVGSDYIYQLYPDRRGRLWMATDGAGIAMWDGTRYHRWDSASGFPPRVVYSVVEDRGGRIWAGTLEGGLYCWDEKGWKAYRREQGLQDNTILALAASPDGSVIAVSEKGADQWYPQRGEVRQYNRRLGLHIDSFSSVLNAVTTDRAGHVVVPYEHGFLHVMRAGRVPDLKPRIVLRAVELLSNPIDTAHHDFAPDENSLSFRYEGIYFATPERLRYRYRLRGYNTAWVETGDEAVTFPRLAPGRYTFQVQAALHSGFGSAYTAAYSFQIAAPLWKRPLFWIAVIAVGAGLGYILLRRRDTARQRLASLQQAKLRAEYDQLRSQVNPHFLFNSLNTLAGLIEEDTQAAVRYTGQLSDLYRSTLAFHRRDLVPLEEEWKVLQQYLYIQQTRFGTALRLDAQLPEDVLSNGRIIPLALQLLVENAIKHNVVSRAHPLAISVTATPDSITVRNAIRLKATPEKGSGIGLQNIRNRYALLTTRPVTINGEEGYFTVTLPIL